MLDIGWSEMAVIALIALIVIGPKDLPRVLRTVGHWTRKARGLAREFQSGVDEMIREADLEDAKKALDSAKRMDIDKILEETVDPTGSVKEEAKEIAETARDTASGKDSAKDSVQEVKEGPGATESGGNAAEDSEKSEGAKIIKQPLQVAPPHSIKPPPPPGEEPAVSASDDKTPEKTA